MVTQSTNSMQDKGLTDPDTLLFGAEPASLWDTLPEFTDYQQLYFPDLELVHKNKHLLPEGIKANFLLGFSKWEFIEQDVSPWASNLWNRLLLILSDYRAGSGFLKSFCTCGYSHGNRFFRCNHRLLCSRCTSVFRKKLRAKTNLPTANQLFVTLSLSKDLPIEKSTCTQYWDFHTWLLTTLKRWKWISGYICTSEIAVTDVMRSRGIPHSHVLLTVNPLHRHELMRYLEWLHCTEDHDVLIQYPTTHKDMNKLFNYLTKCIDLKSIYDKGFTWVHAVKYNQAFKNVIELVDSICQHTIRTNPSGCYRYKG